MLLKVLPNAGLFGTAMQLGRMVRPLLPEVLKDKVPPAAPATAWPKQQRSAEDAGACRLCAAHAWRRTSTRRQHACSIASGIQLIEAAQAGCCGALRYHLNEQEAGLDDMRRNIDAWWPYVEQGVEAIVMTASGCGVMVKEYGHLLRDDPRYAEKAERISEMTRDTCEVMNAEGATLDEKLAASWPSGLPKRIAFHPPCTLQHGQQIRGVTEKFLRAAGFELQPVLNVHLCCGSAGTYSVLQPELSKQLRKNKLGNLEASRPEAIGTANIGCMTHLQAGTATPVKHWMELIDERLAPL